MAGISHLYLTRAFPALGQKLNSFRNIGVEQHGIRTVKNTHYSTLTQAPSATGNPRPLRSA